MAGFISYEPLLRKWLRKINPTQILEFGPGHSTEIMVEECPEAKIHSLETDEKWFAQHSEKFKDNPNVTIIYCHPFYLADLPRSWKKMFDFIFVDGLCDERVACLKTAKDLLLAHGVVLLHDSERVKYKAGTDLFIKVEESNGTLVMRVDRDE